MAIKYITDDGKEFTNEKDALKHEEELQLTKEKIAPLIDAAQKIKEICFKYDTKKQCMSKCPFYDTTINECIFSNAFGEPSCPEKWIL